MGKKSENKNEVEYYSSPQNSIFENLGSHLIDFIQTLVVCGSIFVLVYLFIAQPHKVSGPSMVPTFQDGNFILTDKVSYRLGKPKKGDIIVFKYPKSESKEFIKRIIGVSSDTIQIQKGLVYVNGKVLKEDYLAPDTITYGAGFLEEEELYKVEFDQYIVMGDNRTNSSDSRNWGPITTREIVGKVFFRYWPANSFGFINF